jgi:hypothetical protein
LIVLSGAGVLDEDEELAQPRSGRPGRT